MAPKPEVQEKGRKRGKVRATIAQVATAVTSAPPLLLWIVIIAIALPTWIALIATAKRYDNVLKQRNVLQKPLEKMRNELAEVFEIDSLRHDSDLAIKELQQLDKHMEKANNELEEEKTAYSKHLRW
ncbi:hypothetical protein lerEdw1_002366 [Lerista edwardsae]|nr:hypothetical protein lerEdw1_002368 [Lerista edwardsae]KAJ6650879.1 hypothetical protein lerEdw1_002366 [Lerista edwardsae]